MVRRLVPWLVPLAAWGCRPGPQIEEREVFVNSLRSCPVSQSDAFGVISAAGDFEPSSDAPPVTALFLRDVGSVLGELPSQARALLVDVTQQSVGIDWHGTIEIAPDGPVHVLVWPRGEACRMTRDVTRRTAMTFGVFGHHLMVVGGRSADGTQVPATFVGDLATGVLEKLEIGLGTRRTEPTVTEFRTDGASVLAGALVAGGRDPDSNVQLDTAEVYVPTRGALGDIGEFEESRVALSEGRADHGAVVLPRGETLLVGGVGPGGTLLRTMEIVDPKTRRARTAGVALLATPRAKPIVRSLATGEIFVAGGFDAQGAPIPMLEWFSADASVATRPPVTFLTGREMGFVPLPAGGVLAVIAPRAGDVETKPVWVIGADGSFEPAAFPQDARDLDLSVVRLFAGEGGAPILWTGRQWVRWQPWFGGFKELGTTEAPSTGPALDAIGSGDGGLALWLEDRQTAGMYVSGFRFASPSRFSAIEGELLVDVPDHFAPDGLAGLPGSSIFFDTELGLSLEAGASAFLADLTFADLTAGFDVTASAPFVVLRQDDGVEFEVGGAGCPYSRTGPTNQVAIRRRGAGVELSVDGGPFTRCVGGVGASARVAIGLRGAPGPAVSGARRFTVRRD